MPLYLEWAPLGVFSAEPEDKASGKTNTDNCAKEDKVSCVFQFFCTSGVYLYDLAVTIQGMPEHLIRETYSFTD